MTRAGGLGGKATRNGFLPLSVLLRLGRIPVVIVGFDACLKEKKYRTDEQKDRQTDKIIDGQTVNGQKDKWTFNGRLPSSSSIAVLVRDRRL